MGRHKKECECEKCNIRKNILENIEPVTMEG